MAIFIADLAFEDAALLRLTKLAILTASILAAVLGGLLTFREKIAAACTADRSRCASPDAPRDDLR